MAEDERASLLHRVRAEQAATRARISAHQRSFEGIVAAATHDVPDDEHDPDGATVAYERARVSALRDAARATLRHLEAAEQRLLKPDAGACDRCGAAITYERLLARPATTRCVGCA